MVGTDEEDQHVDHGESDDERPRRLTDHRRQPLPGEDGAERGLPGELSATHDVCSLTGAFLQALLTLHWKVGP